MVWFLSQVSAGDVCNFCCRAVDCSLTGLAEAQPAATAVRPKALIDVDKDQIQYLNVTGWTKSVGDD